jgi:hypothetical protein
MPLKVKLETLEGVPPDVAKEYTEVTEGDKKFYTLGIEGGYITEEPVDALKRAKDHEKNARQTVEKKLKEQDAQVLKLQEEIDEMRRGNIPKADVDKLEGSWKEKLAKKEAELTTQIGARDRTLQRVLVESVAVKMAGEVSVSPDLILPHIRARLTTELVDGEFTTRVLDKEGKPSALSIEELQKDIMSDKRFAPIIKGSKASGGGAAGGAGPGGSGNSVPAVDLTKPFNPNKASAKELVERQKALKLAKAGA